MNNKTLGTIKKMAVTATMLLLSSQAISNSIGIGLGITSEFSGSDDYGLSPIAAFEWDTRIGIFKNDQIGAQLDLIKSGSLDTGPILRINTGRNDSVSDVVIAALPEVEASAEAGWFIGSGFTLSRFGLDTNAIVIGRLSVVTDIGDGHGGSRVNGSVGLVMPFSQTFRMIPSVSFNYADESYTQAFYGVGSDGAVSSGLAEFNPSGGLESTQFALVAIKKLNTRWSLTGTVAYDTLQENAALSPITQRGSETQVFTGLVANYFF